MRNLLLTLIIFLPTICFSQADSSKAKITYGAENEILPNIGDTVKEYHGETQIIKNLKFRDAKIFTLEEFSENGRKIKSTIFPLDNLTYKTLTKFNEAGFIILIASYNFGLVTSKFQKFYENGKIMEEGFYDRMKKVGEWKYYNEQGEFVKSKNY